MNELLISIANTIPYLQTMSITDVIDILIVAAVVYVLLGFIRRTHSVRIAVAIVLLIVILWVSNYLNLSVTNFLARQVFSIGFIAVIVLFRPEIRRVLDRVGSKQLVRVFGETWSGQQIDAVIDETYKACMEMSEQKTGALIVFERTHHLDDLISSAQELDAVVSQKLLMNIFVNKSPLHDGAVIISSGRIACAGCQLPMPQARDVSSDLGMRHRAAVGVTQNSDAIAVVVSEETGSISIAKEGNIKRHLTPEIFRELMYRELVPDDAGERGGIAKTIMALRGRKGADDEGKTDRS